MNPNIPKFLMGAALALGGLTVSAQGLQDIVVETYHTVTQADADAYNNNFGGGSFPLAAGMKVYRVYVDMAPGYKLIQVYGAPAPQGGGQSPNPLDFTTTTTFWNDDNFGGEVPGQTRRFPQGTAFDSYITVNTTGTSGGAAGCGSSAAQFGVPRASDTNGNLTMCTVYPGFSGNDGNVPGTGPALTYNLGGTMDLAALTADVSTFTVVNESWTTLPASQGVDPNGTNQVLIAQFTTDGTFSFHLNVQLSSPASAIETYVWNQGGAGETVSSLLTFPQTCVGPSITGTTSNSPICSLNTLNLGVSATGTEPLAYTWSGTGTISNGNTANASVTGAATGNYTIQVSNACGSVSQNVAVTVNAAPTWYADTDGDGFGDPASSQVACTQPSGFVANNTDLCPTDAAKQAPGACGCGVADVATTWYADVDGDGLGDPNSSQAGFTCTQPSGYVANNTDLCPNVTGTVGSACDDGNANTQNDVLNGSCQCVGAAQTAFTGPSSSQSPYLLPLGAGNTTTSILTVGDQVGGYKMVGIPDGIGAFDNGNGTFTLLMNHELGATVGVTRAHGSIGAFVSKWVINKSDLQVQSGADLVQTVQLWNGAAYAPGTTAFNRLCSGDLPAISAFYNAGTGKGTQDRIYMNGEESGAEGRAFAHVATGASAGTTYQLPRLGRFSWENSVACPVASDKTIVAGTDDATPGQVYVYVGTKTSTGSVVDKAGLTNGKLYGIAVTGLATETDANFPATSTAFTMVDLGDVSNLTGAQLNTNSNAAGVTNFLRPEDASWDPTRPGVLYVATTNAFANPSRLYKITFTNPLQPELGGTIEAVLNGTEGQKMMDNIGADQRNNVYIVEDVGNNAHIGKMWQYDIVTDGLTQVAYADSDRFLTGAPMFLTQDEEASGVIDAQDILGKGKYLLDMQAHYATTAELVEGGQMLLFATGDTIETCVPPTIAGITPGTTLCSQEELALAVAANGTLPLSYSWSGAGTFGFGSSSPSAVVTNAATGTYSVTVSNACGSIQGNVSVTVNAAPTWYADVDGDGLGDPANSQVACTQPSGFVSNSTDACPAVIGTIGSSCDDGNANTFNDVLNASCVCEGSTVDCDDNDPCTIDSFNGTVCVHTPGPDADGDGTCDLIDGCPNDPNKIAAGVCGCGVADVATTWYADADGDGLGDPNNSQAGFTCVQPSGFVADNTDACPAVTGTIGSSCNDGDANTINDMLNASCVCEGTPVGNCQNWTLTVSSDNAGGEITWTITDATTSAVVANGGPYADNITTTETVCLPPGQGCYFLNVLDAGGNGITGGGYVLRDPNGARVIDNAGNGAAFTSLSRAADAFCTEIGTDKLRFIDCDNEQRRPIDMVVAEPNAAVSAQWQVGSQTDDGYEFWFFDPNGGYSRRVFRNHATSGGYAPANAQRACKLNLQNVLGLPQNTLLNVRIRGRVNGVNMAFGPACRIKVDPVAANCPSTQLRNDPSASFVSCGASNLERNGSSHITANPVTRSVNGVFQSANRYRFKFENEDDQSMFTIVQSSYPMTITPQMPFQYGASYNVQVQASFDGGSTWCPYGATCQISFRALGVSLRMSTVTELEGAELSMWPNPNRDGLVNLVLKGLLEGEEGVDITLFNAMGQRVFAERTMKAGTEMYHTMDLKGGLPAGVYTVNIAVGEATFISRLVIE